MSKVLAFMVFAFTNMSTLSIHAQDMLSKGMSCYSDILDDWKDQDKIGSTGYRDAISAIIPTLPEGDRNDSRERLDALDGVNDKSQEIEQLYIRICSIRRAARMRGYVDKFKKVVFSMHPILGKNYFFGDVPKSGGVRGRGLELLTLEGYYGTVTHLLKDGEARHPNVSFDGKRALFSWRGGSSGSSDYHIYEMDLNTHETRQLTSGKGRYAIDLDPCYLPNGNITFVSTRYAQEIDCTSGTVTNLMLCDKDGKYTRQIGFDQAPVLYPTVMNDGRVLYARWDYNDKVHTYSHALFSMNPDGTAQQEYCNNNSWWPTMILQQRAIPNSTKIIAMIGGYHTVQWGKIGIIDVSVGNQNGEGVTLVAPVRSPKDDDLEKWGDTKGGPYPWRAEDAAVFPKANAAPLDRWGQTPPMFAYPYPLDENAFLVSHRPVSKESSWKGRMGLYFMTIDGERELLYTDAIGSCMGAYPAMPREVPPVISGTVDYTQSTGVFQIMKINTGLAVKGIADGVITRLRVVELYFRPGPVVDGAAAYRHCGPGCINYGGASYHTAIATENASWDAKWIVGETPVEEDGSAHFRAPARAPLFFQALNAKGQVVQTMRSWTTLQPGETFSCIGCHDSKLEAPQPLTYIPLALRRGPLDLEPFYGPRRGFTFDKEIQPILNEKCVTCHDGGSNSGDLDLRKDKAYNNLTKHDKCEHSSKYVSWFHAEDSPIIQPPNRAGSMRSLLDKVLDQGHKDVRVTEEEMRKIRCWIDLGVPRWGTYEEGHSGSEANLRYRNQWIAQEKKNIAEFIPTVGIEKRNIPEHGKFNSKKWRFTSVRAGNRLGRLIIYLEVPSWANGQKITINLHDIQGKFISVLFAKPLAAGNSTLLVDSGAPTSGMYLVNLKSMGHEQTVSVFLLQ